MSLEQPFSGVYKQSNTLYTENVAPGKTVYDEKTLSVDGTEYRAWSPHRSKAAAALTKGLQTFPVERDDTVLYLGASTGTTVSHVADITSTGIVYAVEYAPKIVRQLVNVAAYRAPMAPILGDARKPREYAPLCAKADVIYQDVAQRDQIRILKENADMFLKEDGHALIAIKAQSISSSESAEEIFESSKEQLRDDFEIVAGKKLAPFHTDHLFLVLKQQ